MPIGINGSGTITGISAGGLPDNVIVADDIASGAVTQTKLASGVAGNGPAFRAYSGSNQTGSSGTYVKIQINTENFDTASCFDTALYRFTPNVAGYYQVTAAVQIGGTGLNNSVSNLYKNGSSYQFGQYLPSASSPNISVLSSLVYMNGTTDYLELYATGAVSSGSVTFNNGSHFAAVLVRAA